MAPLNLQGLNIVHPVLEASSSDSRDLLLSQTYPDISAQLDLWTNLNFESEEPLSQVNDDYKDCLRLPAEEEQGEARSPVTEGIAVRDGHSNVVDPTNVASGQHPVQSDGPESSSPAATVSTSQLLDSYALLSSLPVDAFAAAADRPHVLQEQHQNIVPSLAQLIAFHSIQNASYPPGLFPYPIGLVDPTSANSASSPFVHNITPAPASSVQEENHGSTKHISTRKPSTIVDSRAEPSPNTMTTSFPAPTLTPLSAAEDKRRRNTAASARFRLKKKEREAALETKAKELETKVVELERECEALRRENGWLKGLVVGVTGATATSAPSKNLNSTGSKRKRGEMESES